MYCWCVCVCGCSSSSTHLIWVMPPVITRIARIIVACVLARSRAERTIHTYVWKTCYANCKCARACRCRLRRRHHSSKAPLPPLHTSTFRDRPPKAAQWPDAGSFVRTEEIGVRFGVPHLLTFRKANNSGCFSGGCFIDGCRLLGDGWPLPRRNFSMFIQYVWLCVCLCVCGFCACSRDG